jgi:hypothetical protein
LNEIQSAFLRDKVIVDFSDKDPGFDQLGSSLGNERTKVLEISDWHTSGLGGPTRADRPYDGPEPTDFIDFMRNIGSPQDKEMGGGTYGYGKSTLWLNSQCGTICVHTSTRFQNGPVERFMACRVGSTYDGEEKKHTGRHWWGRVAEDEIVDPLEGEEAASFAANLGMEGRPQGANESMGSTLMIIDPDLGDRTPGQFIGLLKETLLWFFWPKMLDVNPATKMTFEVGLEGEVEKIENPSRFAPLKLMVESYEKIITGRDSDCEAIKWRQTPLGKIATDTGLVSERVDFQLEQSDEMMFPKRSHHVALMRRWGGIVKYYPGPEKPNHHVEYGGVFITEESADDVFAKSEPPAHDDWIYDSLEGREKSYVRTAVNKIWDYLQVQFAPILADSSGGDQTNLAPLAGKLGGLLFGLSGMRVGGRTSVGGGGGGRARSVTVTTPQANGFEEIDGIGCALFVFEIKGNSATSCRLAASPKVLIDDGGSMPEGVEQPQIIRWKRPCGNEVSDRSLEIEDLGDPGTYEIAVSLPEDCAVKLGMSVIT